MSELDERYERELLKHLHDVDMALRYYINENRQLRNELDYYKNAYENRVDEYLKERKD